MLAKISIVMKCREENDSRKQLNKTVSKIPQDPEPTNPKLTLHTEIYKFGGQNTISPRGNVCRKPQIALVMSNCVEHDLLYLPFLPYLFLVYQKYLYLIKLRILYQLYVVLSNEILMTAG